MRNSLALLFVSLWLPAWAGQETNFTGFYRLDSAHWFNWRLETNGNEGALLTVSTNTNGLVQLTLTGSTGPAGSPTPYVDLWVEIPDRPGATDNLVGFSFEFDSPSFTNGITAGDKAWFIGDWLPGSTAAKSEETTPDGFRWLWGDSRPSKTTGVKLYQMPDAQVHRLGWRLFSSQSGTPPTLRITSFLAPDPGWPTLKIRLTDTFPIHELSWPDATCHLEATGWFPLDLPSTVWTNFPGGSPLPMPPPSGNLFLRLTR
jgi:hypothetical protein